MSSLTGHDGLSWDTILVLFAMIGGAQYNGCDDDSTTMDVAWEGFWVM